MARSKRSRTSTAQKAAEGFSEQVAVAVMAGAILAALTAIWRGVTNRS